MPQRKIKINGGLKLGTYSEAAYFSFQTKSLPRRVPSRAGVSSACTTGVMIKSRFVDRANAGKGVLTTAQGSNDLLAVRREESCISTSYAEFNSLSATKPHRFNDTQQNLPRPACQSGAGVFGLRFLRQAQSARTSNSRNTTPPGIRSITATSATVSQTSIAPSPSRLRVRADVY